MAMALATAVASPIAESTLTSAVTNALSPVAEAALTSTDHKPKDLYLDVDPMGTIFGLALAGALGDNTIKMSRKDGHFEPITDTEATEVQLGSWSSYVPNLLTPVVHAYHRKSHKDSRKDLDFYLRAIPEVQLIFPMGENQVQNARIKKLWALAKQGIEMLTQSYKQEKINGLFNPLKTSIDNFLKATVVSRTLLSASGEASQASIPSGAVATATAAVTAALLPPAAASNEVSSVLSPDAKSNGADAKAAAAQLTASKTKTKGSKQKPNDPNKTDDLKKDEKTEFDEQVYKQALADFNAIIGALKNTGGVVKGLDEMKHVVNVTLSTGFPPAIIVKVSDIVKKIWTETEIAQSLQYLEEIESALTDNSTKATKLKAASMIHLKDKIRVNGEKFAKEKTKHLIQWELS